jgi:hypothetical protein
MYWPMAHMYAAYNACTLIHMRMHVLLYQGASVLLYICVTDVRLYVMQIFTYVLVRNVRVCAALER